MMREGQLFRFIVRMAGVVVELALIFITFKLLGIGTSPSRPSILVYALTVVIFFALGVAIMRTAKWIVFLAFGAKDEQPN
jgi:hypothetical protein